LATGLARRSSPRRGSMATGCSQPTTICRSRKPTARGAVAPLTPEAAESRSEIAIPCLALVTMRCGPGVLRGAPDPSPRAAIRAVCRDGTSLGSKAPDRGLLASVDRYEGKYGSLLPRCRSRSS
jgi:hypothetical protein